MSVSTCCRFGLVMLGCAYSVAVSAQSIGGFWLGVTYPDDPTQKVYNYSMNLTLTGTQLGGTAQTANPGVPFGGVAYLSGQSDGKTVRFAEADKNGRTDITPDVCYWRGVLIYNPADESLTGTYENITNNATCTEVGGGRVELYRIVLKSGSKYCRDTPANLFVTGKNIRWYASASKGQVLATGNAYNPVLSRTTTFYITQTLYKQESPPVPITVEIIDPPVFSLVTTKPGCGKTNGVVFARTASNSPPADGLQFSLNGGPYQAVQAFPSLAPGSYTVTVKDPIGCEAKQSVVLLAETGATITSLKTTPPRCGSLNGAVSVLTSGGVAPLTYALDGTTFGPSPDFKNLPGGSFTVRVRDAAGCETTQPVSLPASISLVLQQAIATATRCGEANGVATLTVAGGTLPVQYSADGRTYQPSGTFQPLRSGVYTLLAKDGADCTVSQSVSIAASTGPSVTDVTITPEACGQGNGAMLAIPADPSRQDRYAIDGATFQPGTSFSALTAGTYTLTVSDGASCVITRQVVLPLDCPSRLYVPTAFSPNADGTNDDLTIYFRFPSLFIKTFAVYDRWGAVIYDRSAFSVVSGEALWDGSGKSGQVTAGVYQVRLDCEFPGGSQVTYRQAVMLVMN